MKPAIKLTLFDYGLETKEADDFKKVINHLYELESYINAYCGAEETTGKINAAIKILESIINDEDL